MASMNRTQNLCKTVPYSVDQLPQSFQPFNDKIDIVLQYLTKINSIIKQSIMFKSYPVQFNVNFVPPLTPDTSEFIGIKAMAQRSSLNEMHSIFCSEEKKMMTDISDIFVVRKNEYDTNGDLLYLFSQQPQYGYNEILCNVMNIMQFNVSYDLNEKPTCRMFMYYNGFGERVVKQNIIRKWPVLFVNGKNNINNGILSQFISSFDDFLVALRYVQTRYQNTKQRILNIPKDVLKNHIPEIAEFNNAKQPLYYYLTWTCRMQAIDGELIHYTLQDMDIGGIAIFNTELHEKHSNNVLFALCLTETKNEKANNTAAKWKMYGMMTSYDIYNKYGIDWMDLPVGSRYIHNSFQAEIGRDHISLQQINAKNIPYFNIKNWKKYSGLNVNNVILNKLIKESTANILSHESNLSLIPTLTIDVKKKKIDCESLIPIQLPNEAWIAVSCKSKTNQLYLDCDNILNKAALVNPNAFETYKYLKKKDVVNDAVLDRPWIIQSLQKQLNASLQREDLLFSMLKEKDDYIKNNTNVINMGHQHYQEISNSYFYFSPNAQFNSN